MTGGAREPLCKVLGPTEGLCCHADPVHRDAFADGDSFNVTIARNSENTPLGALLSRLDAAETFYESSKQWVSPSG